jgi:hypothetical protein
MLLGGEGGLSPSLAGSRGPAHSALSSSHSLGISVPDSACDKENLESG